MPFIVPTLGEIDAGLTRAMTPCRGCRAPTRFCGGPTSGRSCGASWAPFMGCTASSGGLPRQAFPDIAEGPELLRWAAIWGVEQVDATQAEGAILVAGTAGTVVPAGSLWRSGAAIDYQTDAEFVMPAAETGNIDVTAVVAGAAGNAPVGVILNLVNPIAGLAGQANVSTALAGGADIESIASVRARLLARIQNPPRGGTSEDYEQWAQAAHPDVTRAWARPLAGGLGTVTVYFMTDDATANGIPNAATVTAVDDYIAGLRPVTADVTVSGPTPAGAQLHDQRPHADDAGRAGCGGGGACRT